MRHGGSFALRRDAEERARYIGGELAAMREPVLRPAAPAPVRTFAEVSEAWRAARIDHAPETAKNTGSHLKRLLPTFGKVDPASITVADVQEWLAAQDLKPSSLKRYLATLRQVLDHTGADPNRPATPASVYPGSWRRSPSPEP